MEAKRTVLLVDDDAGFARSARQVLEAHGYNVLTASDGEEGLALLKQTNPDLLVLDITLAMQTDGFECQRRPPTCLALRRLPVLLVADRHGKRASDAGIAPDATWLPLDRMMDKPIDPVVFLATVAALLRRRVQMDAANGTSALVKTILSGKTSKVCTIDPGATVLAAVETMERHRIGCLLVVEAGKVVGVFTERDCMRRVLLHSRPSETTLVREVMTSPVICVWPDDTIEACMSLMTHKRIRHLPVMEGGELVGIISIGDLVRATLAQKSFMIEQLEHYITAG